MSLADYGWRIWSTSSTTPRPGWPATPRTNGSAGRPTRRASWPACSAPPTGARRSRRTSNDPGFRNVTFDELVATYAEAARGLVDGGADLLLVETIFDTLNAKAAMFALEALFDRGRRLPVMISGTIIDASGRTLSGQTTEAFWNSVAHAPAAQRGAQLRARRRQLRQYVQELSRVAPVYVSAHPNAGLPNEFGGYDETPEYMAGVLARVRRARAGEPRGRLLRHDAGAHPRDRRRRARPAAARSVPRRRRAPSQRARAAHDRSRQLFVERRRADQRHRLAQVRAS